jgi:hypothetical protein
MLNQVRDTLVTSLNNDIQGVVYFVPKFITGLVILLIGIIIASIVKQAIVSLSQSLKLEAMLKRYGVPEMRSEYSWTNILAEIGRWFVIIIFLIPTADVWGLPRIGTLLNQLLLYLRNVFVAAIIGLGGFALARIAHDVILGSVKGVTKDTAQAVASVAQWAINVVVILAVLNQRGVASDLIRILFTGRVAMVALAGGIAFGLGGQDSARDTLSALKKRLR